RAYFSTVTTSRNASADAAFNPSSRRSSSTSSIRCHKISLRFIGSVTLTICFRHFGTLCNKPVPIALDNRSELVSHPQHFIARHATRQAKVLPQRGRFCFAAFQLEHHAFDVAIILVPPQECQALL